MSESLRERARDRRAKERFLFEPVGGGDVSICLVYPNTYAVGMANLGFQAVFRLLHDDPHVTVERAFVPDGPRAGWQQPLRSLEADRPLGGQACEAIWTVWHADGLDPIGGSASPQGARPAPRQRP